MQNIARRMASSSAHHYDTIVLGAGISGLAAASRLFEHPRYKKKNALLVLEARDRIGGRIGAVEVNGCRLDTGANWIHGVGTEDRPNPLMKILPRKKFKQLSRTVAFRLEEDGGSEGEDESWMHVDTTTPLTTTKEINSGKSRVIPAETAGKLMESLWSMIGSLGGTASETPPDKAKHTSMLQAITASDVFQDAYRSLPKAYHRTFSALPQFIENMEAAPLVAQSAEHAEDSPGFGLLEFAIDDFDGDQVFLRDGYMAVVNELAKHLLAADIIRTGVPVQQIRYDGDLVQITTDGDTFTAREVLCTLPLGVLKHHLLPSPTPTSLPFFYPPLPTSHTDAIAALGFGTLDKIFLVYDSPWWNDPSWTQTWSHGMVRRPSQADDTQDPEDAPAPDSFIGFTRELAGVGIAPDGTTTPSPRVLSLLNLDALTGYPVLSAFVSCANASVVEAMGDAQASAVVHRALTAWLGREPPRPSAVHVTRWAQDAFSRGSYSHMVAGRSETGHREVLGRSVEGGKGARVRFAGEHTSRDSFATVHGAVGSGWREADGMLGREG